MMDDKENDDDDGTLGEFRRYSARKRKHTNHFSVETFSGRSYSEPTKTKEDERNVSIQGDDMMDDKENDDDDGTLGDFRRYSARKRKHTNHFLVDTFSGRSYSEPTKTNEDEQGIEDKEGESEEEGENRRYPLRKRRQVQDKDDEDTGRNEGGYSLRRNRRKRVPFNAKPETPNPSRTKKNPFSRWIEKEMREYKSSRKPKRRRHFDSSSESSSEDERRGGGYDREEKGFRDYQRRKEQEDLARIRPLNMGGSSEKLSSRDLMRADANPVEIDRTIDWSHVGGLEGHVRTLKEMVVLPLMYPEVFERFKMQPPRGVIFHGPPGTGKTLVARALANSCCVGEKRVAFFMRKGADVVSKWVGEAERQLRLLFEQAKRHQPSIIFFDEIDGLAPVRSVRF